MKVKMLQAVNGKVNGERMGPYAVGAEYEIEDERAILFIGSAMAEEVIPPPVVVEHEEKSVMRWPIDPPAEVAETVVAENEEPAPVSRRRR